MLTLALLAQIALMTVVPLAVMVIARRRLGTMWSLLVFGFLTFVISQAVRWPFLWLVARTTGGAAYSPEVLAWLPAINIAVLCLTSGLFEEGARYLGYRLALPGARRWQDGVTYGLGHGGCEAILLGALVVSTFIAMLPLKGATLASLPRGLDASTKAMVLQQVQSYWGMPAHLPLLGGMERLSAMCFHVAMALLVLRAVRTARVSLLLLAMALHAGLNGAAVLASRLAGPVAAELLLALVAGICVWGSLQARPSWAAPAERK